MPWVGLLCDREAYIKTEKPFSKVVAPTDIPTNRVSLGVATSSPALGDVRLHSVGWVTASHFPAE